MQSDVIIVGGGFAGLSAGLLLARCRRKVVVIDAGRPRNASSPAMHGFVSRDGADPGAVLRDARVQLEAYGVHFIEGTAERGARAGDGFTVHVRDGSAHQARHLLLATGLVDVLPPIEGLRERWGKSVVSCPYCDAWELRDRRIALLASGEEGLETAEMLRHWSRDLVLLTDGEPFADDLRERAGQQGIEVECARVVRLEGPQDQLARIVLEGERTIDRDALFVKRGCAQGSDLPRQLGCSVSADGQVQVGEAGRTAIPGLWVIGDAAGASIAIIAAGQGASAAMKIQQELQGEPG